MEAKKNLKIMQDTLTELETNDNATYSAMTLGQFMELESTTEAQKTLLKQMKLPDGTLLPKETPIADIGSIPGVHSMLGSKSRCRTCRISKRRN